MKRIVEMMKKQAKEVEAPLPTKQNQALIKKEKKEKKELNR